jgi:hypothetical protein
MAAASLSIFGLALTFLATTEMMIAGGYSSGQELTYIAEAGLEIGERELARIGDWNLVLNGTVRSAWVDGDSDVPRALEDGSQIVFNEATNRANCGKVAVCTPDEIIDTTDMRPWGRNNPRWQLFAFGSLNHALVAVWVADDPAENDDEPLVDGSAETNPGSGIVAVRAEAFGVGGAHKTAVSTVRRGAGFGSITRLSWAQFR